MRQSSVVIIGGGPGGYEAALVAAQLGADVSIIEKDGMGGAAVLTDCVPSKALISTADYMSELDTVSDMGVRLEDHEGDIVQDAVAELGAINQRVLRLARSQSEDITTRLRDAGVRVIDGFGRIVERGVVAVDGVVEPTGDGTGESLGAGSGSSGSGAGSGAVSGSGAGERLEADVILVATGATPRVMPSAVPDGERILTWQQIYDLRELPERLVVIGSGVTGAELAQAYLGLGAQVVLVSSRDRVLPGEDPDAAQVIEDVFRRRGMEVLGRSRAKSVERTDDGVLVTLEDGRTVTGSHALLAVGSVPLTSGIGLEEVGVQLAPSGHIQVDRVSRTGVPGIYAAGDCTGVLPLASVAAMQGRIAMWHALGDAVAPLNVRGIAANIFTDPEIATVGIGQKQAEESNDIDCVLLPLSGNPRAKMLGLSEGFVKLFAHRTYGTVMGGVVVAPRASELVHAVALAVSHRLSVDNVASTITVYPSLSGSVAEAARRLHRSLDD